MSTQKIAWIAAASFASLFALYSFSGSKSASSENVYEAKEIEGLFVVPGLPGTRKEKIHGAIMGSFAADALALSWHWVYDASKIHKPINKLQDPRSPYHPKEKAGDLTTFGDQQLVLLQSIKEKEKLDIKHFADAWKALFENNYQGYVDSATKTVLANLLGGFAPQEAGSHSHDFTPVGRIAPFFLVYNDEKLLTNAVRLATKFTHNYDLSLDAAEYFAKVTLDVIEGVSPVVAIQNRLKEVTNEQLKGLVSAGIESRDENTVEVIAHFGTSCGINGCLPSTIHCIVKYENNFHQAIEENIAAGGESATRGMAIATVLGAHHGIAAIPSYARTMKAYPTISKLLD